MNTSFANKSLQGKDNLTAPLIQWHKPEFAK